MDTITLKTTAQDGAKDSNQSTFRFGPMHKDKNGTRVMSPVVWEFRNGTDWKLKDSKYTHRTNPDAKEVTLTYKCSSPG